MNYNIQNIWKDLCQELQAFIYQKVKDEEVSRDILQEVFLKVHLNIHKLKDCSKLTPWVYQITRNQINNYFRKQLRTEPLEDLELADETEPSLQRLVTCVNSKIAQLPHKSQEVMVLTTFQNLKQTELADYLGISYSGTKSRVQRAKGRLKELVKDCEFVETDKKGNIMGHDLDD